MELKTRAPLFKYVALLSTELKTYYLSYSIYKHDAIDITDPSSIQDAYYMNFVIDLAHRRVCLAQWYYIEARNPEI